MTFIVFVVEFVFEVRVYEEWDNQLRDKTSEKYKELSALLKKEVYFKVIEAVAIKDNI